MQTTFFNYTIREIFRYSLLIFSFSIPCSKFLTSVSGISVLFSGLYLIDYKKILPLNKLPLSFNFLYMFYLFHFTGLFWTTNLAEGISYISKTWPLLLILVITLNSKIIESKKVVSFFIAGVLLTVSVSFLIQFFGLNSLKYNEARGPIPFMDHRHYSLIISLTSALILNFIINVTVSTRIKKILFIILITIIINLFMSGSRTGIIIFLLVAGYLLIRYIYLFGMNGLFKNSFIVFLLICPIACNYSLIERFGIAGNGLKKAILFNDFNSSWGARLAFGIVASDILKTEYLAGVGTGDAGDSFHQTIKSNFPELKNTGKFYYATDFHNQFIQSTVQFGIPGLLLMIYFLFTILKLCSKHILFNGVNIILFITYFIGAFSDLLFTAFVPVCVISLSVSLNEIINIEEQ